MPRVAVVSDFGRAFGPSTADDKAEAFRRHHDGWRRLAVLVPGLEVVDAVAVRADPACLGEPAACLIDTPALTPATYHATWRACEAAAPGRTPAPPDAVAAVLGLNGSLPQLAAVGVESFRTALVPVTDGEAIAIDTPADVARLFGDRLDTALADAGLMPAAGLFVRGFFASLRSHHPASFFAATREQLHATACRVVRGLRTTFTLGGLAVREYAELEQVTVAGGSVPLEVRLVVLGGRLVQGGFHGPFEELSPTDRATLADTLDARRLGPALEDVCGRLTRLPAGCDFVADVVFRRGEPNRPIVSELNPLYCSGYRDPTARARVQARIAADLAERAGDSPWTADQLSEAETLLGVPSVPDSLVLRG